MVKWCFHFASYFPAAYLYDLIVLAILLAAMTISHSSFSFGLERWGHISIAECPYPPAIEMILGLTVCLPLCICSWTSLVLLLIPLLM
jgi:hypothetical protein